MKSHEQGMLRRFVLDNDAGAFAALSEQYAPLVYRVCWRILRDEHKAADATQETFLELVRRAYGVHGSVGAWLHRVATGKAIDILRKENRQKRLEEGFYADLRSERPDWRQLSVQIDEALNQLSRANRDLLIEHYLENRSTREIAQRKGVSQATVSRRITAALKLLRRNLGALGVALTPLVFHGIVARSSARAVPVSVRQALGKMGMAGHGQRVGLAGKVVYRVGSLDLAPKVVAAAALVAIGTLPLVVRFDGDRQEPSQTVAQETGIMDPDESSFLAVPATGVVAPPEAHPQQDTVQSSTKPPASVSAVGSPAKQEVPKVVLKEPLYYRVSGSSKPEKKKGPVKIKIDTPRNTIKTFVGLLGEQDVDRVDSCLLPGSDAATYWQEIVGGTSSELADLREVLLALDLPVEITQMWQEQERVGVIWMCNVTKELDLKALRRQFIPWDVYTLQVELLYADGQWLIDKLWSE